MIGTGGSPCNDESGERSGNARVFVYSFTLNTWEKLGNAIAGLTAGDYFGSSLSISKDNMKVFGGAPHSDENGESSGHVRVFAYSAASNA